MNGGERLNQEVNNYYKKHDRSYGIKYLEFKNEIFGNCYNS